MKHAVKKIKGAIKSTKKSVAKTESEVAPTQTKSSHGKFVWLAVFVLLIIAGMVVINQVGDYFVSEVVQPIVIVDDNTASVATTTAESSVINIKAPAFSLAGNTATNTSLLSLLDKPLVVVFWTTWQPAAVDQLRAFDEYFTGTNRTDFNVVFVNYQEDDLVVRSFLRRSGYDLPVVFDETGGVGNAWQARTVPTTYLVGTDGFIKEKIIGNYSVGVVVDKLLNINQ